MASTTSNYISKIKQDYPIAGQDNDSQGFRDNFKNISLALTSADDDISDLKLSSIKLNQTNDFGNTLIKQAQFQDCSVYVFDDTAVAKTGDVTVDYREGSYQKFSLDAGSHTFTVNNWPGDGRSGSVIISVTTPSTYDTYIDFAATNLVNLSSDLLPYKLTTNVSYLFEVSNDGTDENVFVKKLNEKILEGTTVDINSAYITGTHIVVGGDLTIGGNRYTVNTSTRETVVSTATSLGTVALLPNQVTARLTGIINDPAISTTATQFLVSSANGIITGAKFTFYSNTITDIYTVLSIDNNKITTQEFDSAEFPGDAYDSEMIFTNPRYNNAPTVMTLRSAAPASTTLAKGDLKGQIYANSTSVYVSYSDYEYNTTGWVKLNSLESNAATTATSNTTTSIATTQFVHNVLPYGSIIMWYGTIATIPFGWALCNGTNGTPNLVNRFIIGAVADYNTTASTWVTGAGTVTGGSKDAVVVTHSHDISDGGHSHTNNFAGITGDPGGSTIGGGSYTIGGPPTNTSTTGISVLSTGTSGNNMNLPPYYALAYIMKTTGD